jgi:hypothetical protein
MTTTPPADVDPITNQEIPVMADRVARVLITDMLAEARTYLGDLIDEEINNDPDAKRLDPHTHGIVYGRVWDLLGTAGATYRWTDEILTAAAARVAALPTANDGQLIAAYRDIVLNTITTTPAAPATEG